MSSLAPLHRSDTDRFAAGLGAALARAVAPARLAAAGLLVVFAALLALPLQAQAQTSISQTAEGATWTLTGHTSVEQGSTYTFTLTLASGSKPNNEYAGFHLPGTSDNQDKLGTDPDDCTSPKQFCVSFSGGQQGGIWDNVEGHDTRLSILPSTTPHTLTATFTVATDATLGSTIEFGAITSHGLPRDNGMIITVVAGTTTTNTAATGKPGISGTAAVGQTLTATTSGISDADGKTNAEDGDSGYAYTYQWILVDGNTETDISGETSSTYRPSSSDVGKTIRVRVSFTDDLDNAEGPLTSEQTAAVTVAVSIEPNYDSIGAGLEDLVFTLTRQGATTDALEAMVTIVQDRSWLGTSDLSHTVTFVAGSATATLTLAATRFSFDPDTSGDLTATVSGAGIADGEATVEMVSTADAPITVSYDKSSYTFAEDAANVNIYVLATLDPVYPRAPSRSFRVHFSTVSDTATFRQDYVSIIWASQFFHEDYEVDGNRFVARKRLQHNDGAYFGVENDEVYEGPEGLVVTITRDASVPSGLVQFAYPDGTTCESHTCPATMEYPVTITDEEDRPVLSLSAAPASIAEEDDDTTTNVAENVSVLTVAAASPKTFATEQTITLTFGGSAVYGTHYSVSPVDADANATGHQVLLPAETASVQVTVTAAGNDTADGNRLIEVAGSLDGMEFDRTSVAVADNETTTNTAATGKPGISGTAAVGQTLTATTSGISDADGKTNAEDGDSGYAYTYQWILVDGNTETDISGETSSTYRPSSSDVGKTIRVRVSFTDDLDNAEGPLTSEQTAAVTVAVSIEPNYDSIGAGLEDLVFTLTRQGATTDALEAMVTIVQDRSWLGTSDLSHTVTFVAGSATATLTLAATRFSFDPDTSGDLTATVSGAGIADGEATVEMVSTADAPITVSYDKSSYTFAEDAANVNIYVLATLDPVYPRAPSRSFRVHFSTVSDTATFRQDYVSIIWASQFFHEDYEVDGNRFVARKRLQHNDGAYFGVENDEVYEGPEGLVVTITRDASVPSGLVQFAYPAGTTCESHTCPATMEYPVTITDEEDRPVLSLSAAPALIAEEDDDTTTNVAENVSVLTVAAASPKTFATEQTITLTFGGSAVYGTHYSVSPVDADANATGHQVLLPAETASVQVTVTAAGNDTADGNRLIEVAGSLDGMEFDRTSVAVADNETTTNTAATGKPGISGTAAVGQTLTATTSGISDADGKTNAEDGDSGYAYTYQWILVDGNTETDISGETSSTYRPSSSDVGKTIRVRVSFTDDLDNAEGPLTSEQTAAVTVAVSIEPNYDSIGAGLEDLVFTLTRQGATTDALEAMVTIVQDRSWLGTSDLSHTVTFVAGSATATLTLAATRFSFDPDTSGDLTATVSGAGIADGEATVEMVSTADAPITVSYDKSSYTFAEDAANVNIYVLATLDPVYPRAPSRSFRVHFSTVSDTATFRQDYVSIIWAPQFFHEDYEVDGNRFVARKRLQHNDGAYFGVENDEVYEGPEGLVVTITRDASVPSGLVQFAYPDGTTCESHTCPATMEYPVTITDEEDRPVLSLSAAPASIAEEDDDTTTNVAENVSVLTVAAASPKTFATEQTITLTFGGSAVYGTHYSVSPVDADANATGHQVLLPAETASVQVTVTAAGNDTADGNRLIEVAGSLDGMEFDRTSVAVADNETTTNTPATGKPGISGTAQVGQMLTATTTDISDADGKTKAEDGDSGYAYTYQWILVDGNTETDISGETSSTYTPSSSDVGKTIRVRVSFTDDLDNAEGPFTSEQTATVIEVAAAGICGRTLAVRAAILNKISSVNDCANVTDTHLAAITGGLPLSGRNVTALAVGDFAGLDALTRLNLSGNTLTTLPAGVFGGLDALTELRLDDNALTTLPDGVFGGLDALTELRLYNNALTALPAGVFAGLDMLTTLSLSNSGLDALPDGVFAPLTALTTLYLSSNGLATLPAGVFAGLDALTKLRLNDNALIALPAGVFAGLDALTTLWLNNNALTALPAGVFAGLDMLTTLWLDDNALTALPDDVFEPLTALTELKLTNNSRESFAPEAVALPDDGTVSDEGGTVTLDGSGSGGAWGTNVTYGWALTEPASGVTFDDDTSVTPKVTVPSLPEDTELTFTLTVTGRGGTDGILPGTDTAKVRVTRADNTAPTASDSSVTTNEDTAHHFAASDFNFDDTDTDDTLASVTVVTLPTAGVLALNGTAVTAGDTVTKIQLDANQLTFMPAADGNGDAYASFTFRVSDGTEESAADYSMTVNVTAVNDAATGKPTIEGTAQAGETLMAGTSGIMDADGLPASFTYQWVRVDSDGTSNEMDIGSNSDTYTLMADDVGKKVKVKVTFTDNGGTTETVTSDAYPSGVGTIVAANTAPTATDSLVTTDEDTAHHFAASEFNFNDTDAGDTLASVTVVTLPAAGALALDGTAVTAGKVVEAEDIGKLVFTPVLNANGTSYASFTFRVSDGTDESAADYSMTVNVTAVNDAATGKPTIMGTAQVDETLMAGTSGIMDADGLPASFTYQWVRVDSDGTSNEMDIGSNSDTYTLMAADVGKKVKVKVTFTDNGGTTETVTSDAYPSGVGTIVAANTAPTATDSLVTTDEDTAHHFAASEFNFDDTDASDTLASVTVVTLPAVGALALDGTAVTAGKVVEAEDIGKLVFTPVLNANGTSYASFTFRVSDGTDESAADYSMTVNVTAVNDAATGKPTIEGTAQAGETLMAGTSGIMDADGLSASFTYQWVRVDSDGTSNEMDIGSNSDTYTLMADDVGKKVRVKVSFNDNGGTTETVTSDAYPSGVGTIVAANTAPTATDSLVTTDEDTAHHFAASEFNFNDTDAGDTLASVTVVTLPTVGALALDGTPVTAGKVVEAVDIGKLVFTPVLNANGTSYASFTFRVSDGTDESVADYIMTVNVTAVNDDATGKPTIMGTAQVGETLMAGTSDIMDADGLPSSFTYQWVRVDSDGTSNEMDIGLNSDTYTLMAADEGKKVKVKVTFNDDGGTTETVTSDVYPASGTITPGTPTNTAPTATDSLVTTDEDTVHHFAASEFNFNDTDAGDTLASVTVVTLPAAGALALNSTAVTAGRVVAAADIVTLVFTPAQDANGTSYASFTFRVSDGTDESAADYSMTVNVTAVNDAATGTPMISGTAQVGEILTASTSGISDNDGLTNVSFTYQWVRVDSDGTSNEMDIGSNSDTYTLMADDEGKKVRVKVSFNDNGGTTETVTSDVYPASGTITPGTPTNTAPTATDSLVTTDEDTAHHFAASEFNFDDTDAGDTLASVTVVTLPAAGALALDGTPVTAGKVVEAEDIGKLVFTPAQDANGTSYASFTFRVSDGTDESAADYSMTVNVTAVNDAATGTPMISGTAQVGEILTASTSGISDNDGLTNVSFTYQWVRVDSDGTSNEMDIGSNSDTYTLMADDEGKKVRVKVTFTDNGGTTETVTSDAYPSGVGTIVAANTAPTATDSLVTTDEDTVHHFAASEFNFNDTDAGDTLASVTVVTLPAAGALALDGTAVTAGKVVEAEDIGKLVFTPAQDANGTSYASFTFKVSDGTDESAADYSMTVNVTAVNDDATGKPTIMGTAQVGETLTAGTSDIMDADGLPSSFTYQWVRVDSDGTSNEMDIGSNSDTYTLMADDVDKKIRVKVTFTDNGGTTETVTSDAYPSGVGTIVAANTAPTATDSLVTTDEDTVHHFAASEFNFNDTDAGDTLASVTVVTLPAAGALALDGTAVTAGKVVEAEDIGKLVFTPAQDANGTSYASFTFKVSDGTDESAADYSMTVNVTAVNDDATGKPTIMGTAQVGEILTASTSGISDNDGLTNVSFTYQWVRVDSDGTSNEMDIGLNSDIYTLIADDVGKKVRVKVSFNDNGGTTETVTSDVYPASGTITPGTPTNTAPTATDSLVTTDEDTVHHFAASEFNFNDTDAGDTLASVTVVTLPAAGALALDGTAVTAGKVVEAVDIGKLVFTPVLNANGTSYASFTFRVSDGTDESAADYSMTVNVTAVNDAATGKPTIEGTAQAGETLMAGTSGIMDADGLSASFTYQWVRVDSDGTSNEMDIGSNSDTYTLMADDVGKKVKVKVTFNDDGGTTETVTSDVYPASGTITPGTPTNTAPTATDSLVTTDEDTAHHFAASEFNFDDTDAGDTLASVTVVTLPAAGALALDGTPVTAGKVVEAEDIGKLVFTPAQDANGTSYASFTFRVSDGTDESAADYSMTVNVTAVNDAATGTPMISGTAQVGEILTASTSGISDNDGLTNVSFTYQWVRVDSDGTSNEMDIGSNSDTYTLMADDEGKKVRVKVTFTDNGGTTETVTSDAYPSGVGTIVAANTAPTATDSLVTTDEDTVHHFAASEFNFNDTDAGDTLASVTVVTLPAAGALALDGTAVTAGKVVEAEDIGKLVFTPAQDANGTSYASFTFKVSDGTDESAADYSMTVNVTAVNDDATGKPTIMGTAQAGETLTAGTSDIMDADGLPSSFTYQWVRVDSDGTSNEMDIGSNSDTYTLMADDVDKKIRVKVTFTDNGGTTETVTSDAYPSGVGTIVAANTAPTATDSLVTTDEDTVHHFAASEFNFNDTDAGDTLASVTVVTLPAAGALALDGTAVTAGKVVEAEDIGKLVFTPAQDANGTSYASFTFKVSDGTDESAADYSMTVNVTAVNDDATGKPTIMGTAQVGETLTAGTSDIMDADGLPSSFTYQWVRVDSDGTSNEMDIGSNSDTYTLMADDEGKKVRVKVTFTDNGGTTETVTSDAYPSGVGTIVAANTAPTATDSLVTTDEDTVHHFAASEFNFNDTDAGDTLASVTVVTLPAAGALALDGTAVTAGKVVEAEDIGKLVFTPAQDANGTSYASFTFKVSDGTDESAADYSMTVNVTAVNDDATGKPTIMGTAQVGEILTASTSGISDNDGLTNVSFTYQWVRVDSDGTSNEMDIGSNSDTYTLMADDVGKKVRVKVSFNDNGGTTETVTSDVYPASGTITPGTPTNTAPTATDSLVTTDEDTAHHFAASEFNFDDTDAGDTLASVTVVTLPTVGALALDGTPVTAGKVVEAEDIGKLVFTPVLNANGTSYASFTFRVSDGTDESVADYIMTVNVTAVNDDATGKPTIEGTAQAGQDLTAHTDGISDPDGKTKAENGDADYAYTYQWIRVDGATDSEISGETSRAYTLMADDIGKTVKVKVSFTDDADTDEGPLISDAYPSSGTIATASICERTPAVRDALVSLISGVDDCVGVTATHLANITSIDLSSQSIADLKAGDFAGLTALMELNLAGNSLTSLPAGVFDGLTSLTSLSLDDNGLESLHDDVFADLTSLTLLTLNDNALNMLPNDVFKPLTELTDLRLLGNSGAPFKPTADALPDDGTISDEGGTVTLDGSGSGGAWGTNVTYSWVLTPTTNGVTFDDNTSATPEVSIPALPANTTLTFTLTVTGSGGTNGIDTDTDTATVTVTETTTTSTDATLSGLTLQDGEGTVITLSPTFPSDTTTDYTASVANGVEAVVLTATQNDSTATVAIANDDDTGKPGRGAAGSHRRDQHADGDGDGGGRQHHQDLHDHGDARGGANHQHRRHRQADDHGHGAGRPDADGGDLRHHGRRRGCGQLHLPVGAGGFGRSVERDGRRFELEQLYAARGRRGQEGQGQGEFHRQREQCRGPLASDAYPASGTIGPGAATAAGVTVTKTALTVAEEGTGTATRIPSRRRM